MIAKRKLTLRRRPKNPKGILAPQFKRTKIIVSVGPSTHSPEKIYQLIKAGANGVDINFAHGTYAEHAQTIMWVREASQKLDKPVAIIGDVQGPKLRVGDLPAEGVLLVKGQSVQVAYQGHYINDKIIPTQHDFSKLVRPGETIFLHDGKLRLKVKKVTGKVISAEVTVGGVLLSRKGINLPETNLGGKIITVKDLADIQFALKAGVDYIALSFVQTASDVEILRNHLKKYKSDAGIIAKIETKAGVENIEEIVKASDGVMVARGDLAIEAGSETVPIVQREIVGLARKHGVVALVATQMLVSMMDSPQPSRADVSDVATAVIVGTDAVMLRDETTIGNFPIETVETMKRIIKYTEQNSPIEPESLFVNMDDHSTQGSVTSAAITLARQLQAKAIITETTSGRTARTMAAKRPRMPIIMATNDARVAQQLAIVYGSKPFYFPKSKDLRAKALAKLKDMGSIKTGDYVVLTYGNHPGVPGGTNTLQLRRIE